MASKKSSIVDQFKEEGFKISYKDLHGVTPEQIHEEEAVNHPKHYNSHPSGIECLTIVEHFTFNAGNTVKYIWRAGLKTVPTKEGMRNGVDKGRIQDLEKALFYLEAEIARLKREPSSG